MAALAIDGVKCDRCGAVAIPNEESPDYTGPREFCLREERLRGGPVLHLCGICRRKVEQFARGVSERSL